MGLPDDYKLPSKYNEAYHLLGDGVVVPVVQHLSQHLLLPIAQLNRLSSHQGQKLPRAA
jgi:DNA (cytosine-5)-methyltransferase 1